MTLQNPHGLIGNTSSNGGFAIVMLVFGGVQAHHFVDFRSYETNPWLQSPLFANHSSFGSISEGRRADLFEALPGGSLK